MNLHGLVRGAISAINPDIPVTILQSTGSTEDASGRTIPSYAAPVVAQGQRQELSGKDIYRLQGQNIQGVACKMYLRGNYEGLFRVLGKGGDLITFGDPAGIAGQQTYLVTSVLERWPDWCCVALTMQLDGAL